MKDSERHELRINKLAKVTKEVVEGALKAEVPNQRETKGKDGAYLISGTVEDWKP